MAIPKTVTAQRDFSAGQLDPWIKRGDDTALMKSGARQAVNWRILNSRSPANRPGRTVLFLDGPRTDELMMSPGNKFYLVFGVGYLRVYNAAGVQVFTSAVKGDGSTAIPWTAATVKNIVWAPYGLTIYIAYADGAPNNVPQLLIWDGVSQTSTWTLQTFAEAITAGGQKRTAFYRISPQNVTMLPSATAGPIDLTFSIPILVSGMIGTRMEYCGRQITITAVTTSNFSTPTAGPSEFGTAQVNEPLPPAQQIALTSSVGAFNIGDVVDGSLSGAQGILTSVPSTQTIYFTSGVPIGTFTVGEAITGATSGATGTVTGVEQGGIYTGTAWIVVHLSTSTLFQAAEVINPSGHSSYIVSSSNYLAQLLPNASGNVPVFIATENIVGPSGSGVVSTVTTEAPQAVSDWDNEIMNTYWGYPSSVFFDQNRLGFCNFPSVPQGIGWSEIGVYSDFYAQLAEPDNAIFELVPGNSQVLFVMAGMESSEFVFCNNAIYYIPITVQAPLIPGSVAFNELSSEGCAQTQPRAAQQTIVYINASGTRIMTVQAPGAYYRPYVVDDASTLHSQLIASPVAIAVQAAAGQFEEQYLYILNANGTIVMGKYDIKNGLLTGEIGWLPWSGAGTPTWVYGVGTDIIFTGTYAPNGITPANVVEVVDNTQYLDAAFYVNAPPAALAPPGGKGPLWWIPSGSVTLIDLGTRFMDTYQIDANGNIIPQFIDGENLASTQLVAGQPWTATLEPFVPAPQPGTDMMQRMTRRRISRSAAYVTDSTGFLFARLFSGPLYPGSPALGTIMNNWRVETWEQGDDPAAAAPLREATYQWRPLGREYDPRIALLKDTPGPIIVLELGLEVSV